MRVHVETLFRCDADGRLLTVNETRGRRAPRVFVGRYRRGRRCWFRNDLGAALVADLERVCESDDPPDPLAPDPDLVGRLVAHLEQSAAVERVWAGPAFRVPRGRRTVDGTVTVAPENAALLQPHFADWVGDVDPGLPFVAVLEDGVAVSICASVRVSAHAHEAGVETHPDFRGRGYAGRAVVGWARRVAAAGRVPLYSTSWQNEASRAVARKLGLVQFGSDIHLT